MVVCLDTTCHLRSLEFGDYGCVFGDAFCSVRFFSLFYQVKTRADFLIFVCLLYSYPLFAFTPVAYGGLGLSEAAIGTHMAVRSAISIVIMLIYAPVQERVGPLRIYQWSTSTWPLAVLCMPALSVLASSSVSPLLMNASLGVFFTIWGLANLSWPSSAVIINDAAPTADALGAVNGLSQMVIVLSEAVAPAVGTALFAVSKSSLRGVMGGNLIWVVLFGVSCGTAMHCWTLEEASHDWRKEWEEDVEEEE